jgi:hypothetical protein
VGVWERLRAGNMQFIRESTSDVAGTASANSGRARLAERPIWLEIERSPRISASAESDGKRLKVGAAGGAAPQPTLRTMQRRSAMEKCGE